MSLPDFTAMSGIEWIALIVIAVIALISVFVVEDEKKKGRRIPGKMCAGCKDNGMVASSQKENMQEQDS